MSQNNQIVTIASPGNSGGGAIHDYLLSRNDFVSPFQGEEFRLIHDPYGINNLYLSLYKDFSLNKCSEAFQEYKKYCYNLKNIRSPKTKKLIYGKNFLKISINYLKNIEYLSYRGIPQFKRISLDKFDQINFKLKKGLLNFKNHNHDLYEMKIPVEEKKFLNEPKKYLFNIFSSNKNLKSKKIILDQATNYWCPETILKYLDNTKIILVTRDPRSVFYSMKFRGSFAYPGYDIKKFVNWYKIVMEKKINITPKNKRNILKIKFEDFVNNFEKETAKIQKFLNLKKQKTIGFDFDFTKKNMFKAKYNLTQRELIYIEKKLKNFLQW